MAKVQYYYSPDGSQPFGPVEADQIIQLAAKGVINSGSYVCPVGDSTWQPWDLMSFSRLHTGAGPQKVPGAITAPNPAQPTFPTKPAEPTKPAKPVKPTKPVKKTKPRPARDDSAREWGILPPLLNFAAVLMALRGLAIWMLAPPALPPQLTEQAGVFGIFGAGLLALVVTPWTVASCFFKGILRVLVRTAGIVGASLWMAHLHPDLLSFKIGPKVDFRETIDTFNDEIRRQVANKGFYSGNDALVDDEIKRLSAQAVGDSPEARRARAHIDVMAEVRDRNKVSDAAILAAIDLKKNITGQGDLPGCRDAYMKARYAEGNVLTYFVNHEANLRAAMLKEGLTPEAADRYLAMDNSPGSMDRATTLSRAKIKSIDDQLAIVEFLSNSVGSWTAENGRFIFSNNDALAQFNALVGTATADQQAAKEASAQLLP